MDIVTKFQVSILIKNDKVRGGEETWNKLAQGQRGIGLKKCYFKFLINTKSLDYYKSIPVMF